MLRHRSLLLSVVAGAVLGMPRPIPADGPQDAYDQDPAAATSRRVDQHLARYWVEHNIQPRRLATDTEFLRRIYLDLLGTLPTPTAVQDFLGDESHQKRAKLVDRLLTLPRHPTHLANTWRHVLIPNGSAGDPQGAIGMQEWLRDQFVDNTRFDRLVGNFLTVTGERDTGPVVFYRLNELQPEKLAAATARCFLGIQLECAQCHDHPFVDTSQEEFWRFAAFFARVRNRYGDTMSPLGQFSLYDTRTGEVTLPEEDEALAPRFPASGESPADTRGTRRQQLSLWMSSSQNPFLAPATVNRVWSLLFGRGLVDPVDDMGLHNPGEHSQLLADLAAYFVQTGYDLRQLFRVLAKTKAYQRSSVIESTSSKVPPVSSFAAMQVKALTADQLYDSLQTCLRIPKNTQSSNPLLDPARWTFIAKMNMQAENPTEFESSVQQTLFMMHGELTESFVNAESGLLAALTAPYLDNHQRLELLFLATLTRSPTDNERALCLDYLETEDSANAVKDVLWSIINCAEFRLNH